MTVSFAEALAASATPVITEIKPASPKVGTLLGERSVRCIAAAYASAGAPCLSVTTGRWHGGSIEMIADMAAVSGLPVLRKDFLTTRRHLEDSLAAGASAVLLTCALLRQEDITRLAAMALELGLTPFVEAASERELEGLALSEGSILAINNRDIRQQERDDGGISRSLELLDRARDAYSGMIVSASGMLCPDDVTAVRQAGFDGALIGTALLSAPGDLVLTTRRFLEAARVPVAALD